MSAVAALASREVDVIIASDLQPDRRKLAIHFAATHVVDPSERSLFVLWTEILFERGLSGAPAVFECVGAPGLIQSLVDAGPFGTRIYAAGGWYTGDSIDVTAVTRQGVSIQFGGGPMPEDWYGTLDAVVEGRLDPLPSIGKVIGLDEVRAALELARRSEGPPRIVVHPQR